MGIRKLTLIASCLTLATIAGTRTARAADTFIPATACISLDPSQNYRSVGTNYAGPTLVGAGTGNQAYWSMCTVPLDTVKTYSSITIYGNSNLSGGQCSMFYYTSGMQSGSTGFVSPSSYSSGLAMWTNPYHAGGVQISCPTPAGTTLYGVKVTSN